MKKGYFVKVFTEDGKQLYTSELYSSKKIAENDFNEKIKTFQEVVQDGIDETTYVSIFKLIKLPKRLKEFANIKIGKKFYFAKKLNHEEIKDKFNNSAFEYFRDKLQNRVQDVFYEDIYTQAFFGNKLDDIIEIIDEIKQHKKEIKKSLKPERRLDNV